LLPVDTVIEGDCVRAMCALPPACADLVFADPPYNLQLGTGLRRPEGGAVAGVDEAWDRFDDLPSYDTFTRAWLAEARRILKPDGAIWVMGSYHNIFRLGAALQDLGFWLLNDVVWRKVNPMPNFRGTRFTNAHETLIWAARSQGSRPTFHYHALKEANEGVQMRSDWLIPVCGGPERLKAGRARAHPTQKPEALLHRVLLATTSPGDLVVDPFFGTGTTGAVARLLGRRWIGIEREPRYVALARDRIARLLPLSAAALGFERGARAEPRVPFGALVETGLVKAGAPLFDVKRRHVAEVRVDGTLRLGADAGSIHRMAARAQGLSAANGWTFWHTEEARDLVPLDALRGRYRAMLGEAGA
jgi:modification methylase